MFGHHYSAIIGNGRVNQPTYDETRRDMRRMLISQTLGSGLEARFGPHARRI